MLEPSHVLVLIPAYNEAEKINAVVQDVIQKGFPVLVVDDGSTDHTSDQLKNLPAKVIVSPSNQGKGASLRKGFEWFLRQDYAAVVLMDADGQHDPAELGIFLRALGENGWDFVIGNRLNNPTNMPLVRVLTNRFMSWVISGVARQKIADSQCGYRAIRKAALQKMVLSTAHFEIESEMLLQASRLGFKIGSVPVRCIYGRNKSRINPVIDTVRFFKFISKSIFPKKVRSGA